MEVPFRRAMVMQVMQLFLWHQNILALLPISASLLQTSCHSLKTSGLPAFFGEVFMGSIGWLAPTTVS